MEWWNDGLMGCKNGKRKNKTITRRPYEKKIQETADSGLSVVPAGSPVGLGGW
jgi:hypothetical protein